MQMAGWRYNQMTQTRLVSLDLLFLHQFESSEYEHSNHGNRNTKKTQQIYNRFSDTHNQRTLMINPALIIFRFFFFFFIPFMSRTMTLWRF